MKNNYYGQDGEVYTEKQFLAETQRCEYCEEKPCRDGCPAGCSPADFIMAARVAGVGDYKRAAAIIMKNNPLGGICGMVCPDSHCMAECSHKLFDRSVNIPNLQAHIINKAREEGGIPDFHRAEPNGKSVAIIGAGPAGLGAAAALGRKGYKVDIYEERKDLGGACNLIPEYRLERNMLKQDTEYISELGDITINTERGVEDISELYEKGEKGEKGYDGIIVAAGLWSPILPGAENEEKVLNSLDYLESPGQYELSGRVAVIGGGAVALDCATTAKAKGAKEVEMFALETVSELPLTPREREEILEYDIAVSGRTKVKKINMSGDTVPIKKVEGLETIKVELKGDVFNLADLEELKTSSQSRNDIDHVIVAVGNRAKLPNLSGKQISDKNVILAGDCDNGPTTVVEAVASGKNAALKLDSDIFSDNVSGKASGKAIEVKDPTRNDSALDGYIKTPVSLETDFFGRKIDTPFLLSAAPPSDGYEQMKKAYEAGWSGGVLKTSFASGPIHIPGEYMHAFNDTTYGNCDNVSGHLLDRVCGEVQRLVKEFPDKLTMPSTGGPVTGNDEEDKKGWQANTKRLEEAGAMGIEYSLSCPQGGEGTEGDIVSQSAEATAKVIGWVMEIGDPEIPKLFKLSAAVTSIETIMGAVKETLAKYPDKKAGVTLANTFPVLGFQQREKEQWPDGIVMGMSGEGVAPVSYFTLARAVPVGVPISGNGGPMDYLQTANFLALGAKTVQYCTIVMKHGYGIIDELKNGVSFLMKQRGISSMKELIGIAQPDPITDFMDLSATKKISSLKDPDLCLSCGNCTRCPYLAITLDDDLKPEIDPAKCIGCSICTKKCFSGALEMRERTPEEMEQLSEE